MEKGRIKLSIIILNWNTKELLKKCLESVVGCWRLGESKKKNTGTITHHPSPITQRPLPITEVIVVDNGSTDGSVEMLRKFKVQSFDFAQDKSSKFKVGLIENKENLGFAKGNNIGVKEAEGEYIMLLNSDTVVKKEAIKKMIDFLDEHPAIDVVGPKLLNYNGTPQASCGRFPGLLVSFIMLFKEHRGGSNFVRWSPASSRLVDWLMGAAFVARKKVFEKVGGLDEKIFMYMEEVEWFYRVHQSGFKTYFLKEAEIIHLGRGSSKTGRTEPILNIYKGLLHFYRKHKSPAELLALEIMLKLKSLIAISVGFVKNDNYLKKTYGEAIKIS